MASMSYIMINKKGDSAMKMIKKFSILGICAMMMAGCFHAEAKSAINPNSSADAPSSEVTSSGDPVTSSEPTPSSVSSESHYSHNPDDVLCESVTFRNTSYSMNINKTITIVATVLPRAATNRTLVWTSSNEDIATVSEEGKVTSHAPGTVTITAMTTDGTDITASATVTVNAIELEGIVVANKNLEYRLGETFYIPYSLQPANTSFKTVTFEIDDESILSVDENGQFTAIGVGRTNVSICTVNPDIYANVMVRVQDMVLYGYEFRDTEIEMHAGEVYSIDALYYPKNGAVVPTNYVSSDPSVATVNEEGFVKALKKGVTTITGTVERFNFKDTLEIRVLDDNTLAKTPLKSGFTEKFNNSASQFSNSATIGNVKWLVVPVWFSDSDTWIAENRKENVRNDITNAFFGTSASVGWRSVSTFYEQESFGKLKLSGKVTEWYNVGKTAAAFKSGDNSSALAQRVLSWYKTTYPQDSISNYDYNKDGVIDAMIMIYARPTDGDTFWAYCALSSTTRASVDKDPNLGTFMWASYAFMYGYNNISAKTGVSGYRNAAGDTNHCDVDTHTYIHESGHLLGADDYYDYAGNYTPAGAYTMQDHDWGMHDPFSVMAYGWADPYIPTEDITLTINSFESSGDLVILTPRWNDYDSPFDEYIVLEYFTPTGINEFDSTYGHRDIYVSKSGVRVWHVDSRLAYTTSYSFNYNNITSNPNIANFRVEYAFNNTSDASGGRASALGADYVDFNILQLIRNYDNVTDKNPYPASQNDFYYKGDTFKMDGRREKNQFPNRGKLNSGDDLGCKVEFLDQDEDSVTLQITRV